METTFKINKPILLSDRQIWYKVSKYQRKSIIDSEWRVYCLLTKSYHTVCQIPKEYIENNKYTLCDQVIMNRIIYGFSGNGHILTFNTIDKQHSIIKVDKPIGGRKADADLNFSFEGNAYSRSYTVNPDNKKIIRTYYRDQKFVSQDFQHQTKWYMVYNKQKRKAWCCTGYLMHQQKKSERYVNFTADAPTRDLNKDWMRQLQPELCSVVVDSYIMYIHSIHNKIYILDYPSWKFCGIDLNTFKMTNSTTNCNGIIVNQNDGILRRILKLMKVENNIKLDIPDDILSVIKLYHGDYYKMKLHLFAESYSVQNELDNHIYHKSINVGVLINQFSQNSYIQTQLEFI